MNQQDHLFENSKQLSQKLAVALTRFFLDGPLDPSLEERYRQFLRRRPFTALQWILHQGTACTGRSFSSDESAAPPGIRRRTTAASFPA